MSLAISNSSSSSRASSSSRRRLKIWLMPSLSRAELRERPARNRPNQPRRSSLSTAPRGVAAAGGSGCDCGSSPESSAAGAGSRSAASASTDGAGTSSACGVVSAGTLRRQNLIRPALPRPALRRPARRRGCCRCCRRAASAARPGFGRAGKADFGIELGAPAARALDQHRGLAADARLELGGERGLACGPQAARPFLDLASRRPPASAPPACRAAGYRETRGQRRDRIRRPNRGCGETSPRSRSGNRRSDRRRAPAPAATREPGARPRSLACANAAASSASGSDRRRPATTDADAASAGSPRRSAATTRRRSRPGRARRGAGDRARGPRPAAGAPSAPRLGAPGRSAP